MRAYYNEEEILQRLVFLNGWVYKNTAIERDFEFRNFQEAFAFLTRVALLSEKYDHHAEIYNLWNTVRLRYSTKDVGGVTDKDLKLAEEINKIS